MSNPPPAGRALVADRAPRRRRGLRIAAAVASAAVLLTSGLAWAGVTRYAGQITQIQIPGLTPFTGSPSSDPMTILLVASDSRAGLTAAQANALHLGTANYGPPRTDTMMLVHIGRDAGTVSVVSLPRDTLATIPAYTDAKGVRHPAHQAKLNAAYEAGASVMVATVEALTGVAINHYVEININGFLRMVDAVDGVEVCLVKPLKDAKSGLNLPAGRQTIRGLQALAFVRARYVDPTADIGRMKRQQRFVASIVKKATSAGTLLNPLRLDAFLSAVASSVTTDSGLGRDQLLALADRLKGTNPGNVALTTVPLSGSKKVPVVGDVVVWDTAKAHQLFTEINEDRPIAPTVTATPTTAPVVSVAPGRITLKVLNGTTTTGLGTKAANDLAGIGFAISGRATNAPTPVGAATVISYDPRYDQSARTVHAAIPGSTLVAVPGLGRTIQVSVGTSYAGARKVTVSTSTSRPTTTTTSGTFTAADDTCS
ncbi:MAG TPA: LCP family protein [Candidatus Angelobacter sp.]|nr:LCP family protein [Candidatus Angelobacter sp.]